MAALTAISLTQQELLPDVFLTKVHQAEASCFSDAMNNYSGIEKKMDKTDTKTACNGWDGSLLAPSQSQ